MPLRTPFAPSRPGANTRTASHKDAYRAFWGKLPSGNTQFSSVIMRNDDPFRDFRIMLILACILFTLLTVSFCFD
jgi:hypothetical protein